MGRESILLVDDNPDNLKLLRVVLSSQGYDLRTACDAAEALALLETFRPRVILLDMQLPGMDGLELTRRLKADARTRDIVIVAVTAYAMKGDQEKVRQAGCDDYLAKPIDKELLRRVVASHARGATPTLAE
jgi:CheY-like chemotaxis protein